MSKGGWRPPFIVLRGNLSVVGVRDPDMSSVALNKSGKPLWNPVQGTG
jgi:hypothetical protein